MKEDWQRIRKLFDEALDLDGDRRERFLREACAGRDDLLDQVRTLLDADARQEGAPLPMEPSDVRMPSAVTLQVGQRVGKFTIESVLGKGGMGMVFCAWQDQPKRKVALKTLQHALLPGQALGRFHYEAEVLGRLHHPNIAEIYEGGTFCEDEGGAEIPFFALELVEDAKPLTRYAAEAGLDAQASLELFLKVCEAVHHGHQQGVLHRDLKPENLLVGPDGRPKVIDFGIARALSAEGEHETMNTEAGQILGTLQYMSPEQLDGQGDVDSRTDVYALGVVLFELMTGAPPFDLRGKPLSQVSRILHEERPPSL